MACFVTGASRPQGGSFIAGGQGELFLVSHEANVPPGEFVLKWLKNPKRQHRFDRELKSLAAVAGHPNVVQVVDQGAYVDPSVRYYVMERADGSLTDLMSKGCMSPERAFQIFNDILDGVKALHDARIIHRDVKPDNVLMFGEVAKVGDTGLCLIVDDPRLTPTFEAVGPRFYMAPELEHGRNLEVEYSADVYSLGKVLFWLLSCGTNLPRERFEDPAYALDRAMAPGLKVFDAVFRRTLTTSPRGRFPNVDDLRNAFDDAVQSYRQHPDTGLEVKLAGARTFRTAFRRLRRNEKEAAFKRAQAGLLPLSADDLLFVARHDPKSRTSKFVELLAKEITSDDPRITEFALLFAESAEGIGALGAMFGPKELNRALLRAIIEHGDEAAIARLVDQPASPLVDFDDLIPAVVARFPAPHSLPPNLVSMMAVFPRLRQHPSSIDVLQRAADDQTGDWETERLALFGLLRSTDVRAIAAVDRAVARWKEKPEGLRHLLEVLVLSPEGFRRMGDLSSDLTVPKPDRELFRVAAEIYNEALAAKTPSDDEREE